MMGVAVLCVVLVVVSSSRGMQALRFGSKRSQEDVSSSSECVSRTNWPSYLSDSNDFSVDLRMPRVLPSESDSYLCMAYPVPTSHDAYIVDFLPHASMETVHHMLLYGCSTPASTRGYWDCGGAQRTCKDDGSIMYAWARNAAPTKLPKDVGFKVGKKSGMTHFVLQIHYGDISAFRDHHRDCSGLTLRMTTTPQPFIAGIYLLMTVDTVIQPGNKVTNADVACDYSSDTLHPFAFRTHTHRLGQVVSGYRVRDGKWTLIGRQSPQLPQAFYPANKDVDIRDGDTVAARCVFTGEGRTSVTKIGGTSSDEMCNFYMMYYMDSQQAEPFMSCMEPGPRELFRNIPAEANIPIALRTGQVHSMMGHSMMGHSAGGSQDPAEQPDSSDPDQDEHLDQVSGWSLRSLGLGQISGLAVDSNSNLVVFHRGDHSWTQDSFSETFRYQQRSSGPIQQSTVLVVDPIRGRLLSASCRDMFYLPHGITTDAHDDYWLTDVALHQVLKVRGDGSDSVLLTLGEAFQPGSDRKHFCQPTDVAVDPESDSVYVSDGYCNARIVRFNTQGEFLAEWGAGPGDRRRRLPFRVPHSLAFLTDRKEVCVADRENGRIQCFIGQTGEMVKEISREEFGGEVFAISYSPAGGGVIFAVNGESYSHSVPLRGFVIDYSTQKILDTFRPDKEEFEMPHDIVQTKDGSVFVADVMKKSVFKFASEKMHRSVKKAGIEVQELEEVEAIVQTRLKPDPLLLKTSSHQNSPPAPQTPDVKPELEDDKKTPPSLKKSSQQGALPAVITTLLLLPLVAVIAVGLFVCWRRNNQCQAKAEPSSVGGILGQLRGKASGGLNLGNFFASRRGYSRRGFDQLSTEGSDQERQEDSSESENEEYSAPPPHRSP